MTQVNYKDAVLHARKLHAEGVRNPEHLADKMKEFGYVSHITKRPLSPAGAYAMALNGRTGRRRKRKTAHKRHLVAKPTPKVPGLTGKINAAIYILGSESLPVDSRISIAITLLKGVACS